MASDDFQGGSAFPVVVSGDMLRVYHGMTVRDYMAGQVVAGYMSGARPVTQAGLRDMAAYAYRAADALIEARRQDPRA